MNNDVAKGAEYYLNLQYPIRLYQRSDGTEEYWFAEIPDLPGCVSDGVTPDEAVRSVNEAKVLWIEAQIRDGYEVPEPFEPHPYSGKLLLRISKVLHRRLSEEAQLEGVSINQSIAGKLAGKVGKIEGLKENLTAPESISRAQEELVQKIDALVTERISHAQEELVQKIDALVTERISRAQQELVQKLEPLVQTPLDDTSIVSAWSHVRRPRDVVYATNESLSRGALTALGMHMPNRTHDWECLASLGDLRLLCLAPLGETRMVDLHDSFELQYSQSLHLVSPRDGEATGSPNPPRRTWHNRATRPV